MVLDQLEDKNVHNQSHIWYEVSHMQHVIMGFKGWKCTWSRLWLQQHFWHQENHSQQPPCSHSSCLQKIVKEQRFCRIQLISLSQLQPDESLTEGEVCISWSISRAALEQMTMHLKNHTNFAIHSRPIQSKMSEICTNVDQFGTYWSDLLVAKYVCLQVLLHIPVHRRFKNSGNQLYRTIKWIQSSKNRRISASRCGGSSLISL
jgi:hypothetical protein